MTDVKARCDEWKAWIERGPDDAGEPTLHVTGRCLFPSEGYRVVLEPAEPQGFNPRDFLMRMTVHEPPDQGEYLETPVPVEWVGPAPGDLDTVSIIDVAPSIPVEARRPRPYDGEPPA